MEPNTDMERSLKTVAECSMEELLHEIVCRCDSVVLYGEKRTSRLNEKNGHVEHWIRISGSIAQAVGGAGAVSMAAQHYAAKHIATTFGDM